jgi:hypothetical protein
MYAFYPSTKFDKTWEEITSLVKSNPHFDNPQKVAVKSKDGIKITGQELLNYLDLND